MISVTLIKDSNDKLTGFSLRGHAEYADPGSDIVCSAVSILTINTVNSIDKFTEDDISVSANEEDGELTCIFTDGISKESRLLIDSMMLGLESIESSYGNQYIKVIR